MDRASLDRLRQRDQSAFRQLFEDHHRRVYALALRLTCDEAAAAELTQDVFVQAWRGLARYRGDAAIETWLHAITLRVARRSWRSEGRRRRREQRATEEWGNVRVPVPESEAMVDLETALGTLPERMRATVVLACIEGYSYADVAEMMGTAVGTVKTQVHRARQLLRERMGR